MATPSLTDLLQEQLGDRLAPGATAFPDFFTEDGVLECPLAPDWVMVQTTGRANIAAYLRKIKGTLGTDAPTLLAAYHGAADPAVTVLEFEATARNERTGASYPQRYVALVKLREGRIALYREYWNPLPVLQAFGGPIVAAADAAATGVGSTAP